MALVSDQDRPKLWGSFPKEEALTQPKTEGILVQFRIQIGTLNTIQTREISLRLTVLPSEGDLIVWPDPASSPLMRTVIVKSLIWMIDVDELGLKVEEPRVFIVVGPVKNVRIENT